MDTKINDGSANINLARRTFLSSVGGSLFTVLLAGCNGNKTQNLTPFVAIDDDTFQINSIRSVPVNEHKDKLALAENLGKFRSQISGHFLLILDDARYALSKDVLAIRIDPQSSDFEGLAVPGIVKDLNSEIDYSSNKSYTVVNQDTFLVQGVREGIGSNLAHFRKEVEGNFVLIPEDSRYLLSHDILALRQVVNTIDGETNKIVGIMGGAGAPK